MNVDAPVEDETRIMILELEDDRQVGEAVAAAVREQGWPLRELRRDDRSLEQVFRELTAASGAARMEVGS